MLTWEKYIFICTSEIQKKNKYIKRGQRKLREYPIHVSPPLPPPFCLAGRHRHFFRLVWITFTMTLHKLEHWGDVSRSFFFLFLIYVDAFRHYLRLWQKKNLCKSCWHMYHLWEMKRHAANRPARHRGRNSKLAREQHASSPPRPRSPPHFKSFHAFSQYLTTSRLVCTLPAATSMLWVSELPFHSVLQFVYTRKTCEMF